MKIKYSLAQLAGCLQLIFLLAIVLLWDRMLFQKLPFEFHPCKWHSYMYYIGIFALFEIALSFIVIPYIKNSRKKIKESIECVTPSGTFNQRRESALIKHTNLLCIDIDSKDNRMVDLPECKAILGEYFNSLYYAGVSIGGDGIFLIFRISHPEFHKQHFAALELFLNKVFHLQVDKGVKSPVSLRVGSYDAEPYYNPNPMPFTHMLEIDKWANDMIRPVTERNETRDRIEKAVSFIVENGIDITSRYKDWFKVGCALASEYGENGRYWFHLVSRMYKGYYGYDEGECDYQYNKCLKYQRNEGGIKIGTFFYLCECHGVKYR